MWVGVRQAFSMPGSLPKDRAAVSCLSMQPAQSVALRDPGCLERRSPRRAASAAQDLSVGLCANERTPAPGSMPPQGGLGCPLGLDVCEIQEAAASHQPLTISGNWDLEEHEVGNRFPVSSWLYHWHGG